MILYNLILLYKSFFLGVCGLPRLSIRSILSVAIFMGSAALISTFVILDQNLNIFSYSEV